jgi:aminoglycoside 2''-phosphotransferase
MANGRKPGKMGRLLYVCKESGVNKEWRYATQIRRHYPEISIDTVRFNQDGQYNDVLVVNEALIFRFARYPVAIQTLQRELMLLRAIRDNLPLPVPNPIYQNLTTQVVGKAFMGYEMLPGTPLRRSQFQTVGPTGRRRLARQLASFLQALHGIPITQLGPVEPLSNGDTCESYADLYDRIRRHLFPHMRHDAQEQVAHHFESSLNEPAAWAFEPKLRHGDFGIGILLFDRETQAMTGIIDLSFAGLGDPATYFAALLASFGEPFYWECANTYAVMADSLSRVQFYLGTFASQEALFGFENGDEAAFASGMANYI